MTSQATSRATTHKIYLILLRRSKTCAALKQNRSHTRKRCSLCLLFLAPFIFSFELFLCETQRKTYQNYQDRIAPCKGIFACATVETKLWLSPSAKLKTTVLARPPLVYQDLSTCHDILACQKRPLRICQSD